MDDATRRRTVTAMAEALLASVEDSAVSAVRELAEVDAAVAAFGITFPTGVRGVRDLIGFAERWRAERAAFRSELCRLGVTDARLVQLEDEA